MRARLIQVSLVLACRGFGANSLVLSSADSVAGVPVSVPLTLTSATGSEPAALGWTFTYPSNRISGVQVDTGGAASAVRQGGRVQHHRKLSHLPGVRHE